MSSYQEKITKKNKTAKTQFEETEHESKLHMAGMLEVLHMEFKVTMINIPRALMDKRWQCNRRTLVWAHLMPQTQLDDYHIILILQNLT